MNNKHLLSKRGLIFLHDLAMISLAWLGAYWLRFNLHSVPTSYMTVAVQLLPVVLIIQSAVCWYFGLYRGMWRFASVADLSRIVRSVAIGSVTILLSIFFITRLHDVSRSIFPLYGLLLIALLGAPRFLYRWLKDNRRLFSKHQRVLIIGAGAAGEGLVRDLSRDTSLRYQPVAFADDKRRNLGQEIHGVRVVGTCQDIPAITKRYRIDRIFIAVPTATSAHMRKIVSQCEQAGVPFHTLPSLNDLASGRVSIQALRSVSLEDLLGRDQVKLTWQHIERECRGQRVLITGGGGSIGSELSRQVARLAPRQLIIVDNSEYNCYQIERELQQAYPELDLNVYLNSVTDRAAITAIMTEHQPQLVLHAAAYKHVPLLQNQIRTALHNNVIGTRITAEVAAQCGVHKFILISTDKAVNPSNVMGASKRLAEIFCQNFNAQTKTQFITVRFGNVLGSAGSVVPLFREQLQNGGPLTVTHPEITRYFMTIPEACQLILQATSMGEGGEIFVLDMGEPIKIRYLAEQLIVLSGKKVGEDIDIVYTGLRPGEKLFEELFHAKESLVATTHEKVLTAAPRCHVWSTLRKAINQLDAAIIANDPQCLQTLLTQWVPEYHSGWESSAKPELPLESA